MDSNSKAFEEAARTNSEARLVASDEFENALQQLGQLTLKSQPSKVKLMTIIRLDSVNSSNSLNLMVKGHSKVI